MPDHRIATGIHATGEIGLSRFSTGPTIFRRPGCLAIAMPSGAAMANAAAHPPRARARLTATSFHSLPLVVNRANAIMTSGGVAMTPRAAGDEEPTSHHAATMSSGNG